MHNTVSHAQFIESLDAQAAESIATAVRLGANSQQMADMLFAAATDHRFIDVGTWSPLLIVNQKYGPTVGFTVAIVHEGASIIAAIFCDTSRIRRKQVQVFGK